MSELPELPILPSTEKLLRLYDNSRISDWRSCQRYFFYRHVRDWAPDHPKVSLAFGTAWHSAMDVLWRGHKTEGKKEVNELIDKAYAAAVKSWTEAGFDHPDNMTMDDIEFMSPRTPMILQEMLWEYWDARQYIFKDPSFELMDIERPIAVPLDPGDDSLWYVGRLDKIFRFRGRVIILDHKSSSAYSKNSGFRNDFIDQWSLSSQVDGYTFYGHTTFGKEFGGIWIDAALVHKQHHDVYLIIPIERQVEHLEAWLWETHNYIDSIEGNLSVLKERSEADVPYLAAFPKNTGYCSNYGGCCYGDVCRTLTNPGKVIDPPFGFKVDHWSPFDTIKLERLGFTIGRTGERPNVPQD